MVSGVGTDRFVRGNEGIVELMVLQVVFLAVSAAVLFALLDGCGELHIVFDLFRGIIR